MTYDVIVDLFRNNSSDVAPLAIARNAIAGVTGRTFYGSSHNVGITEETIWEGSNRYVYPTAATKMKVSSSSSSDGVLGVGARTVVVSGLDGNFVEVEEVVILTGQAAVETINSFYRINELRCDDVGSSGQNVGSIYIGTGVVTAGVPTNKYGIISPLNGRTLMGLFTVPKGHTFYGRLSTYNVGKNDSGEAGIYARFGANKSWFVVDHADISSGQVNLDRKEFLLVAPEFTDVEIRGKADSSNTVISGFYAGWLVDNRIVTNGT